MFGIYAYDYEGKKVEKNVLDGDYAMFMFNQLITAEDVEQVTLIDGLTGEVIVNWREGKIDYVKDVGGL